MLASDKGSTEYMGAKITASLRCDPYSTVKHCNTLKESSFMATRHIRAASNSVHMLIVMYSVHAHALASMTCAFGGYMYM